MARALFKNWFIDFDPVRPKPRLKHHNARGRGISPLEMELSARHAVYQPNIGLRSDRIGVGEEGSPQSPDGQTRPP